MINNITVTSTYSSKQTPSNSLNMPTAAAVQLRPELLKAAKRGDWRRLGDLMLSEEIALVPEVIVEIKDDEAQPPPVKWTHTYGPDSTLHVVASGGDDEKFLLSATEVYGKAKHLLGKCNANGDTPLHCAARSGRIKMLSHLIDLASREDEDEGGGSRLQEVLRKQNHRGETALHEAVRCGNGEMVRVLMSADAELARFPRANGASPLYLAILLGHDDIAEQLYEEDNQLSYSGPDGQNALHVAALRSERMTEKLLAWNSKLTKQGDRSSGRTPLHFAASWVIDARSGLPIFKNTAGTRRASLLLNADESSAYQSDNNGLFAIHVAALGKNYDFIIDILLRKCPDCAQLRDGQGSTFIHIALKGGVIRPGMITSIWLRRALVMSAAMDEVNTAMNAQDDEGNTALHIAVMDGNPYAVRVLILVPQLQLNLQNKKGQTALDLSLKGKPSGVSSYGWNPKNSIYNILKWSGATFGVHEGGEKEQAPALDVKEEASMIKDSATTIGVVSVLIFTVSFTAAFQLPGGYSTGGNKPEGTPELADKLSFQAFLVANNLALFCSAVTTISLMYAGVSTFDIRTTRMFAFNVSIFFLNSSARSLIAAFAFGTYAVLAPVAQAASVLTWVSIGFLLLDIAGYTFILYVDQIVLYKRLGFITTCFKLAYAIILVPLQALWPYVVIGGFMAYWKTHGIN